MKFGFNLKLLYRGLTYLREEGEYTKIKDNIFEVPLIHITNSNERYINQILNDDDIKNRIDSKCFSGEGSTPVFFTNGEERYFIVDPKRTTHSIDKLYRENNILYGKISFHKTPLGKKVIKISKEIKDFKLTLQPRYVYYSDKDEVKLITFDLDILNTSQKECNIKEMYNGYQRSY